MLFHVSAFSIIVALVFVIVYKRARVIPFIAPYLPTRMSTYISGYQPLQSYSFADQAAAGMSSSSFDVEGQNMASGSGEGRVGLDSEGVEEVRRIMAINRCTFDQARLIRHNQILAANGIAPDGTPLDSKAITRL